MPWSQAQMKLAHAVEHGFVPTGSAKGFSKAFAEQVVAEGVKGKDKRKPKRYARGTLGDLGGR